MLILGIDIAKDKFDIALYQGKGLLATGQFSNNPAGFQKLSQWLKHRSGVGVPGSNGALWRPPGYVSAPG